jgi:hypothetical protein
VLEGHLELDVFSGRFELFWGSLLALPVLDGYCRGYSVTFLLPTPEVFIGLECLQDRLLELLYLLWIPGFRRDEAGKTSERPAIYPKLQPLSR